MYLKKILKNAKEQFPSKFLMAKVRHFIYHLYKDFETAINVSNSKIWLVETECKQ